MKKIALILLVLGFGRLSAQVSQNLGDFDKVRVFDRINVELIASEENKIVITGKRSEEVELVTKNGELRIRMKLEKLLKGEEITAKLYYKNLSSVEGNEGAYITSGDTFKQTDLEVSTKEGAEIQLAMEVAKVKVRAVTGGTVRIRGKAQIQDVSVGTGGVVEADELETQQTTVSINAGGEADVRASELVDAKVRAGGTVTIYGSPKKINRKTVLGGDIVESKR